MSSQNRMWIVLTLLAAAVAGCGGSSLPPPRKPQPPSPFANGGSKATPTQNVPAQSEPAQDQSSIQSNHVATTPASSPTNPRHAPEEKPSSRSDLAILSTEERYEHSVGNLKQIGAAIAKYVEDHGHYPHRDLHGASLRYRMHSWRVALLPYLDETALFQQCKTKEYWNAPENAHLLSRIPDVYQSNAEDETKCNYLLVVGPGTCFAQNKSPGPDQFEDGIQNTILVVEVNDNFGVAWTNPTDLEILTAVERRPFAVWNSNGFLALLANGEVVQVSPKALEEELRAMLTIAGGENFSVKEYLQSKGEARMQSLVASDTAPTANDLTTDLRGSLIQASTDEGSSSSGGESSAGRSPIPSTAEQNAAMELVKQLYLDRYQQADNDREKGKLAKEILIQSSKTGSDVAGQYVMLTTAQRIALEHDDLETAKACLDVLIDRFDMDAFEMKVALLRKSGSRTTGSSFVTQLMNEARQLMDEAVVRDDYPAAGDMAQVALAAGRRLSDRDEVAAITRRQREVEKMEAAYRRVQRALSQQNATHDDPLMSEMVGRYFCLMKGDWERGLPYLARGDDIDLRRLAQRELNNPADAANQLALADQWWEMVDQARTLEDTQMRSRALWWYQAALPNLPQGLAKLKAELRIKELRQQAQ